MSEETMTAETPAAEAAPKAKREKKPKTRKVTYFAFARDIAGDEKLNRQQQAIVDAIRTLAVDGKADRAAVLAALTPEVLMTRQKPSQVLGFYMAGWKKDNALFTATVEDVVVTEPAA